LVETTVLVAKSNVLVFNVSVALNFDMLSFFIEDVRVLVSEQLEPSGISLPDLEVA
jgi:hypothetical protein